MPHDFFFSKVWPKLSFKPFFSPVSFKDAIFLFRNSTLLFSRTFYWWIVGKLSQWNFSDKIYKLTKSLHHLPGSSQWTLDSASGGQAHLFVALEHSVFLIWGPHLQKRIMAFVLPWWSYEGQMWWNQRSCFQICKVLIRDMLGSTNRNQ